MVREEIYILQGYLSSIYIYIYMMVFPFYYREGLGIIMSLRMLLLKETDRLIGFVSF